MLWGGGGMDLSPMLCSLISAFSPLASLPEIHPPLPGC